MNCLSIFKKVHSWTISKLFCTIQFLKKHSYWPFVSKLKQKLRLKVYNLHHQTTHTHTRTHARTHARTHKPPTTTSNNFSRYKQSPPSLICEHTRVNWHYWNRLSLSGGWIKSRNGRCWRWSLVLYSAILRSRADSLRSHVILLDLAFLQRILRISTEIRLSTESWLWITKFEPGTFQSLVRRFNYRAIPAPKVKAVRY